jgi:hypothetical protein
VFCLALASPFNYGIEHFGPKALPNKRNWLGMNVESPYTPILKKVFSVHLFLSKGCFIHEIKAINQHCRQQRNGVASSLLPLQ